MLSILLLKLMIHSLFDFAITPSRIFNEFFFCDLPTTYYFVVEVGASCSRQAALPDLTS
jgi:hypothetical protein